MKKMKNVILFLLGVVAILSMTSCSSTPQEVIDAKEAITFIDTAQMQLNEQKAYYKQYVIGNPNYNSLLKQYAEIEGWENAFQRADSSLSAAMVLRDSLLVDIEKVSSKDSAMLDDIDEDTEDLLDNVNNALDISQWPRIQAQKVLEIFAASQGVQSSYAKILADQRIRYYVYIGRTSWDESSDWTTDVNYQYVKREIDELTYVSLSHWDENQTEYFDKNEALPIAKYYKGWGNSRTDVDIATSTWETLKIDVTEEWPKSSHDQAEYYVNSFEIVPEHQYIYEKDGVFDSSLTWQTVTLPFYYAHLGDVGMQIISAKKEQGDVQLQTSTVPAGFAYVGDKNYGSWEEEKDSVSHRSTGRVWHFFPRYYYYSSYYDHPYSYAQYDYWHNNHPRGAGYYGSSRTSSTDMYGTYGSSRSRRSYGTSFRRSSLYASQRQSFGESMRDVGPKFRNRGPGVGK